MNPVKILWLQMLVVCATALGFVWAATQWTAWQLAFQPQLGEPWLRVFGWPVYPPPAFFWWWFAYDAYAHDFFVTGGFIAGAGGVAAFVVAVAMSVWRATEVKKVTTYGSARWAQTREIRTLLTWPGSAIVHDIKGENWSLTAGWRARFGRALLFDPTNIQSAAYNPLLEVRRGEWEVRDVQNIADVLVDPEGALEKRSTTDDPANAGIRREPGLPEHEEIAPEPKKPVHEFEPFEDEPDDEVQRQRLTQRTFGTVARQVSLDPADDMQM